MLGIGHVERNGHHYVNGMAGAPEPEQQAFLAAHPDLYALSHWRGASRRSRRRGLAALIWRTGLCEWRAARLVVARAPTCTRPPASAPPRKRRPWRVGRHPVNCLRTRRMATQRLGIIMNGVTGRMGRTSTSSGRSWPSANKAASARERRGVMPDPILVGRNARKLRALARATASSAWTPISAERSRTGRHIFLDAGRQGCAAEGLRQAIAAGKHVYCEKPTAPTRPRPWTLPLAKGRREKRRRAGQTLAARHVQAQAPARIGLLRPHPVGARRVRLLGFRGRHPPAQRPSWNYRKEDGGGIIIDMYCHWRYVMDNLFGDVRPFLPGRDAHPGAGTSRPKPYDARPTTPPTACSRSRAGSSRRSTRPGASASAATSCSSSRWTARTAAPWPACASAGRSARVDTPRPVWNPDVGKQSSCTRTLADVPDNAGVRQRLQGPVGAVPAARREGARSARRSSKATRACSWRKCALQSWQERRWLDVPALPA